jgi:site-specific recombinase XerC
METNTAKLAMDWVAARAAAGEIRGGSRRSQLSRLQSLARACPTVADLDKGGLLAWQATISHFTPSYRRGMVSVVRCFCRWLLTEGYINPDASVWLSTVREPRRVPRALSADLAEKLASGVMDLRWRAVIALMIGCGLRCVEVARLDLHHWDLTSNTIEVCGKGGHERILPVPAEVAAVLNQWLEERGLRPGPLIPSQRGRLSPGWVSRKTALVMEAAGVHQMGDGRSAHALRHTALSDVLDRCGNVRTVQQMAGHQSLATTEIYLRRTNLAQLREAMAGRSYRLAS